MKLLKMIKMKNKVVPKYAPGILSLFYIVKKNRSYIFNFIC